MASKLPETLNVIVAKPIMVKGVKKNPGEVVELPYSEARYLVSNGKCNDATPANIKAAKADGKAAKAKTGE